MFKWLKRSADGHALPSVGVEGGKNGWVIDCRHLFIQFPGGFLLTISLGFEADVQRLKKLANGDHYPCNMPVRPDDWADQPTRPNGDSW